MMQSLSAVCDGQRCIFHRQVKCDRPSNAEHYRPQLRTIDRQLSLS
ncbi:MAG: hypothetical protein JGK17_05160 [Microcoleus sp. PH2017_10_PVI_O_A]|nr:MULTISPECIES: hypothetical protein [unclassified Microcoleus]MCC3558806.1 hypothetical protein [Microcoleus sp. PH2017_27_LUM_O_A]MCC3404975.1 hypothetical protein [Microcoleus sp. PH2017_10_PVI_O_A]MCC3459005.1 hypothetical protein [Microcoleus sp. PH2017_11_PCY_U_A]MCC3477837.1 hypothetical protein [Microcoleus sp. PH2017_12_PCY_D_A]MCC3527780.1 hypothetical protein [Microcoleus sp. PH2017_21_RUC_O_A]